MTLLHYASKSAATGIGDVEEACRMINLLLNNGADLFVRCRWTNMTALHYAVYFDIAPVVEILLTHSSDKGNTSVSAVCMLIIRQHLCTLSIPWYTLTGLT